MKAEAKQAPTVAQVSDENDPVVEAYTIVKSQDQYVFRIIQVKGGKVIATVDTPPYWHVEACNKFKIAAGRMFQEVLKDVGQGGGK
jgi:hypothetical protein